MQNESCTTTMPVVSFRLINYENHKEQLRGAPFILLEDLAVAFYHGMPSAGPAGEAGDGALVSAAETEQWKVSLGRLYRRALENCQKNCPARFDTLRHMIGAGTPVKESGGGVEPEDPSEEAAAEDRDVPELYVLTNRQGLFGASVVLYPGLLHAIAQRWNESFYIIPSSVHEVILIREHEMIPLDDMRQIIHDINGAELAFDEILSGEVYYYDQARDRLRIQAVS